MIERAKTRVKRLQKRRIVNPDTIPHVIAQAQKIRRSRRDLSINFKQKWRNKDTKKEGGGIVEPVSGDQNNKGIRKLRGFSNAEKNGLCGARIILPRILSL